jgi:hypothetical protein
LALAFGLAAGAPALADTYQFRVTARGVKGAEPPPSWVVTGTPSTQFSPTAVNGSANLAFTVMNQGGKGSLTLPAFSGVNAGDFSASGDCQNVVKDATCEVVVQFNPQGAGARSASLQVGGTSLNYTGTAILTDPGFANVSLLMHMEGLDNGTTFTDVKGHAVTRNLYVTTSAGAKKFGTSSARFYPYQDSYLRTSVSPDFAMGTGDFTVEMFVSFSSTSGYQWLIGDATTNNFDITRYADNRIIVYLARTAYVFGTWTPTPNVFHHVALSRNGNNLRFFIDGVQQGTTQPSFENISTTQYIIGAQAGGTDQFNGYMDELRVTKGLGRYTANFTVPTAAFPDQ